MNKFNVIYADPPWHINWDHGGKKSAFLHYPVMQTTDIAAMPVRFLRAEWCTLFMWATFPVLPEALFVMEAWGFRYATIAFVWVKRCKKANDYYLGLGNYTRANAEVCLLGTSGHCQKQRKSASVRQICDARIGQHSEKPNEIYDRIVTLFGDVPRIELFARRRYPGWAAWGNEIRSEKEVSITFKRFNHR